VAVDLIERSLHCTSRHPWELARLSLFSRVLLRSGFGLHSRSGLLDVGAGDAWFAASLRSRLPLSGPAVCWDTGYSASVQESLSAQHPELAFASRQPDGRFDIVLLLDVLEHIEKDAEFLQRIVARNLSSEGYLLISVPAWPQVFSGHDVRLKHYRRYEPTACRRLVTESGLRIIRSGGAFHSLLLVRAAQKLLRSKRPTAHVGMWKGGPILTSILTKALAADGIFSVAASDIRMEVPGLSWWALCQLT